MKTTQEMFDNIIKSTSSYPIISEAMSVALDVLMDNNDEINTSHIDLCIYDENKKHGIKSSETLRGRRARHIIKDYIRELVIASIKEEILKNDDFRIPENGKNDGLFDEAIISRYEIEDFGNGKDDWENYASFDIILKGTLKEAFDTHSCEKIMFRAIFESSHFSDCVEMTEISEVEGLLQKIEMLRDYDIPVDNLEELANYLLLNRNKNLIFHAIRCPTK